MRDVKKVEIFEEAFRDKGFVGSRRDCVCGNIFYNSDGGWDWEDGELEGLAKNIKATDVDYSVGTITFEGKEHCLDCDCWHKRALTMFRFLMSHNSQIVALFRAVKKHEVARAGSIEVE